MPFDNAVSDRIIRRNDHSALALPEADWTPGLSVSVVIPAHGQQERLDVVLAALAAQTYPAHLLETVVVDDGSDPGLRLPEIAPANTKLIPALPGGWASAHATNSGVESSDGDVVLRLDSDMLAYHDHVESQLRRHHAADYLAVLGHKRFVDYAPGDLDPEKVYETVKAGKAAELFDHADSAAQWTETIIELTDDLRNADHRAFRVLVGASFSVPRALFLAAGGMDADVLLGSDTVFGYRLHQAGAAFVPDNDSSSWHLGPRQIAARGRLAKRYRKPLIANRVPELDVKRPRARRSWVTPLVDVFINVGTSIENGTVSEEAEECVDAVLRGTVADVRVTLLGEWPEPDADRRPPLDDPDVEARMLAEAFRGEARVRLASEAADDPSVPYRLRLPPTVRLGVEAIGRMIEHCNEHRLGSLELTASDGTTVRLERAAAFARAAHLGTTVEAVWGAARLEGDQAAYLVKGSNQRRGGTASAAGDAGRTPDAGRGRERGLRGRVLGWVGLGRD